MQSHARTDCTRTAPDVPSLLAAIGISVLLGLACASDDGESQSPPEPWGGPDPIELIDAFIVEHAVDKSDPDWKTSVPRPPYVQFDPTRKYYWFLTTTVGMMKIEFKPEWSPNHVSTAIYLTRIGYYDDLAFHRVIPGFMAQGGDPLGDGTGGPGFRLAGEFHKKAKHDERGVLSAANRGPHTDGSQFFITFKKADNLDGKHTVYGILVEGAGTLRTLEAVGTKDGKPTDVVTIRRAEVMVE
jgi:cyclophilin family peptidyl-prolyl cis-trans isomerase